MLDKLRFRVDLSRNWGAKSLDTWYQTFLDGLSKQSGGSIERAGVFEKKESEKLKQSTRAKARR